MSGEVGMVLGKFLPPHRGHLYLCEFALAQVSRLHVVVGSLAAEPIPGELRFRWMRELLPGAEVHHLTDENPQEPHEHPEFWRIWRESLLRILPEPVDVVFASEEYGERLAAELGARFVPVDLDRTAVATSGTAIRNSPDTQWQHLPRVVRPYFVDRVTVAGPESSGKTTLAAELAAHYGTVWVPEYARGYLSRKGGEVHLDDMLPIARGQLASEAALAREANRVLITDTDARTTTLWSQLLFGCIPEALADLVNAAEERARKETKGRHLTLLLAPDLPFESDPIRYAPEAREAFFERLAETYDALGREVALIRGAGTERLRAARAAIDAFRRRPRALR